MSKQRGLGYRNGIMTKFGSWWHCGGGMRYRYALGGAFSILWEYDPYWDGRDGAWLDDSEIAVQYRVARWIGLSGYFRRS